MRSIPTEKVVPLKLVSSESPRKLAESAPRKELAAAEAARLEAEFSDEHLLALIRSHGQAKEA